MFGNGPIFLLPLFIFESQYILHSGMLVSEILEAVFKQDILRKKYPYNCFVMTLYQSLLMALVSLPFCVYTRKLGPEEVSVSLIAV